jgi:hypothetical protein
VVHPKSSTPTPSDPGAGCEGLVKARMLSDEAHCRSGLVRSSNSATFATLLPAVIDKKDMSQPKRTRELWKDVRRQQAPSGQQHQQVRGVGGLAGSARLQFWTGKCIEGSCAPGVAGVEASHPQVLGPDHSSSHVGACSEGAACCSLPCSIIVMVIHTLSHMHVDASCLPCSAGRSCWSTSGCPQVPQRRPRSVSPLRVGPGG